MPALSDVLSEAASHDAFEVIMETGQPVLMNTSKGGVPIGDALSEDELVSALSAVLDQEQQVELMVGNVVEFELTAKGDWHVVTEPGADGITIRARVAGAVSSSKPKAGPAVDLPPVAPFSGDGVELPPVAEDSFSNLRLSESDGVAAADLAAEFAMPEPPAADPMAGDTFEAPGGGPAPIGLDPLDPLSLDDSEDDEEELEFDLDTEPEDEPGGDFALVEPPPGGPPPAEDAAQQRDFAQTRDLGPAMGEVATSVSKHESATRLNLVPPPASPIADTRSDLGSVSDDTPPVSGTFDEVAAQVPVNGLTLVHGADVDEVAAALECETVLVDSGSDPVDAAATLHDLPRGSLAVVRVEDPSRWLAWSLRRLEEGYGVLLETRALTPGGGKRCLLGPTATVRAESWLGRHVIRSLIEVEGVWTLVLPQ
jgi:hypothetical protein